jgi:hypothetical protein
MKKLEVSNNAILLGRGVDKLNEENFVLSSASEARAGAMVLYYNLHRDAFRSKDAMIVASGGYARLSAQQAAPPHTQREGRKMADMLVENGVPSSIIEIEVESGSTTENYEKVIEAGFFEGKKFTAQNPLLVGASIPQGRYRGVPLARAGFGIEDHTGVGVLAGEKETPIVAFRELMGGMATAHAIHDVEPHPFNATDMAVVGVVFEGLVHNPRELITRIPSAAYYLIQLSRSTPSGFDS